MVTGTIGTGGCYSWVSLPGMTDASTDSSTETRQRLPRRALAGTRAFVARHGGTDTPVRGVVERLGRRGGRLVLVGADGRIGDVMVPSVEVGERLVAEVPGVTAAEWDSETVAATTIGPRRRRAMAGPRGRR